MMPDGILSDVRAALALPAYRRLLLAYTLGETAYWFGAVTLSLLVLDRTGSALGTTAFFLAASFLPALASPVVVARLAGAPPGRTLAFAYAGQAVLYAVLATLAGSAGAILGAVLALALLDGILAISARALSRAATAGVLAPAGALRAGNAVSNTAFSICFLAGPALAGAVVASSGVRTALTVAAALFAAMALVVVTTRGLPTAPAGAGGAEPGGAAGAAPGGTGARETARARLRAGLRQVWTHRSVRAVFTVQAATVLMFAMTMPVEVVFVQRSLHAGADGYGVLLGLWGGGMIAGSAVYARIRDRPGVDLIVGGLGTMGLALVVMGTAATLAVALGAAVLGGFGNGVLGPAARTAVQEATSPEAMPVTMGLWESLTEAVPGAGIVLGGAIATAVGAGTALATAGVGAVAVAALAALLLRERHPAAVPG